MVQAPRSPDPPDTEDSGDIPLPNYDNFVTEDDTPVDNFMSEKQQRLLTETLYSSWSPGQPFIASANVAIYPHVRSGPIVPDVLVSLGVTIAEDWWAKRNRTYFAWELGKIPEVVVEIVSNRAGDELTRKLDEYQQMRVDHYVVFDPQYLLTDDLLRVYSYTANRLSLQTGGWLQAIGLNIVTWEGSYEGRDGVWLRWTNADGQLLPTGFERAKAEEQRAEAEKQRAEAEKQRAETEKQRAETEKQRAEVEEQRAEAEKQRAETEKQRAETEKLRADRLAARLKELGIDPESLNS